MEQTSHLGEAVSRIFIVISLFLFASTSYADYKSDCRPLRGPPGPTGPIGPAGPKGLKGKQGPSGVDGLDGQTGPTGPTGPSGCAGCPGPRGSKGNRGSAGPQGSIGPTGMQGPMGPQGPTGPFVPTASMPFVRFANFTTQQIASGAIIPLGNANPVDRSSGWAVQSGGRVTVPKDGVYLVTWIVNIDLSYTSNEGGYDAIIGLENTTTTNTGTFVNGSNQTAQVIGVSLQNLFAGMTVGLVNFSNYPIQIIAQPSSSGSAGASYTLKVVNIGTSS